MQPQLARQLARVERRLFVARTVAAWPWCATATFAAAAVYAAADVYYALGVPWSTVLGVSTGASFAAALGWAMWRRGDALAAAMELDRRCRLAERVSSAVALEAAPATSPEAAAAAAMVQADAERAAAHVDVAAAFPVRPSRRLAWPLVPLAALAAIVAWLAPPTATPTATASPQVVAQVKENAESLEKKFEEKKKVAEKLKLIEAQKLLDRLQEESRKLADDKKLEPRQALVKLNDLAKELDERRKEVAGSEQVRQQLSRLRSKHAGPADKLAHDLQKGDFEQALDELQKLRKQLDAKSLNDEQRRELTKQFDELQKQIEQMAQDQQQRNQQLAEQLAQKQKQEQSPGGSKSDDGKSQSSDELGGLDLGELSKQLAAREAAGQDMQELQKALEDAVNGMKDGDGKQASQGMEKLQQQLEKLQRQRAESQLLEDGMQDLAECKNGMCREGGKGERQAAAPGRGQNQANDPQQPGSGIGRGEANNQNPTDADDKKAFDSRVRPDVRPGPLRIVGPTDGPNAKGRALQIIQEQAAAVDAGTEAQPIERQSLDRSRRDQKRQYFDSLRKGE
jgi:hypothetical protein